MFSTCFLNAYSPLYPIPQLKSLVNVRDGLERIADILTTTPSYTVYIGIASGSEEKNGSETDEEWVHRNIRVACQRRWSRTHKKMGRTRIIPIFISTDDTYKRVETKLIKFLPHYLGKENGYVVNKKRGGGGRCAKRIKIGVVYCTLSEAFAPSLLKHPRVTLTEAWARVRRGVFLFLCLLCFVLYLGVK